ncbi:4Fe-4S binding protein [Pleomorphovibrio marinus]|uniref:4Fe-4S binding protein n=1 Tax=Pleomorphovibrio marinus TaxID=2164132 RepID=UPI000E0B67BD|nr:4Fe-4S dicluster domain-containing protein [Pleomorphovibrio marinus]
MKIIQYLGLALFVGGLLLFSLIPFIGQFTLDAEITDKKIKEEHQELLEVLKPMYGNTYSHQIAFVNDFNNYFDAYNDRLKEEEKWDEVIYEDYAFSITKASAHGPVQQHPWLFFAGALLLPIIGALMYIFPLHRDEPDGIKNNGTYFSSMKNRGWLGILTGTYLIGFYIILYWNAEYLTNLTDMVDGLSMFLSGEPASQWFLYGCLYTLAILVMGIRMFRRYKGNPYQIIRTYSVMFFQLAFAFLIPEILVLLNMPWHDFKNIWPLDYDFFFEYRIEGMLGSGALGMFMLVWGIILIILGVPIFTYFYGKRWYCSWICGCGGLAETLGDPYRHLSDKSLKAWKIERYMVHGVLVFAVVMTGFTIWNYFSGFGLLGDATGMLHQWYGFLIGAAFAGVIGTGFYPFMGNRVWCRFGCPLAAYLGIVQRFKSRFRITTNGGQCISCGNCSTYCEMGIDVKWYAQRGQNIVRASCVGCGICSAVCPRGVLKLENKSEKGRINEHPIIIGNDSIKVEN